MIFVPYILILIKKRKYSWIDQKQGCKSIKQKTELYPQLIKTSLKTALRTIKIDSGEEASLPAVTSSPSFATRLRSKGKIPKSLLLPVLANSYKTSRDTRLIAWSKNSLPNHASPTTGYPNTIGYPVSQPSVKYTHLAYIFAETESKHEIQAFGLPPV